MNLLKKMGLDQEMIAKLVEEKNHPLYRAGIIMKAFGIPREIILGGLRIDEEEFEACLHIEDFKNLYNDYSLKFLEFSGEQVYERMLPLAAQVYKDVVNTTGANEAVRLSAANSIIDRARGKPRQSVDITSKNINVTASVKELDKQIALVEDRLKQLSIAEASDADAIDVEVDDA